MVIATVHDPEAVIDGEVANRARMGGVVVFWVSGADGSIGGQMLSEQ